jgi:hypothetical protein
MAAARGVSVHWGRAWEAGGAPPYWPFIQVLRSVCRGLDADALGALAGAHGTALLELMPELRQAVPGLASGAPAAQPIALDYLTGSIHSCTRLRPRLPSSWCSTTCMSPIPPPSCSCSSSSATFAPERCWSSGTYRDAEARLAPEVGRTLTLLAREATVLPLRRLSQREVADFVTQATGAAPSIEQVDAIQRRTEGNPLFLRELMRLPGTSDSRRAVHPSGHASSRPPFA